MIKLIVLGILSKQPMHGYEIYELLKVSQVERWSGVLPGSIYYALKSLSSQGFIRIKETEQSGHRNKAVYEITEKGEEEFNRLLLESWQEELYSFPKKLYTLLAFAKDLPINKLTPLIEQQIHQFEKELLFWDWEKQPLHDKKGDFLSEAIFENGRKHLELDIKLLKTVLDYLNKK